MIDMHQDELAWLRDWQGRAAGDWLETALDTFAPFAPLGAQLLWVVQPGVRGWLSSEKLAALARALETPEGVAKVREYLRSE
jgi:hypothetical protein